MTEQEAKAKWCPFTRTAGSTADYARVGDEPTLVGASVNREPGDYDKEGNETAYISGRHRCIGSACMAWRWDAQHDLRPFHVHPNVAPSYQAKGYTLTMARPNEQGLVEIAPPTPTDGYCGLAGNP